MDVLVVRLGELGIGLVWGFLLAGYSGPGGSTRLKTMILAAATIVAGGEVLFFSDWRGAASFISAALTALLLRLAWYHELEKRFHTSS